MKVEEYLVSKGWRYQPSGMENYQVEFCPFCGDNHYHFGIHKELGLWRCLKCEASGNLHMLQRRQGDLVEAQRLPFSEPEQNNSHIDLARITQYTAGLGWESPGYQYLLSRGFTAETIQHFRLGLAHDKSGYWLTFPYFMGNECRDIKFRSIPPLKKLFKKEANTPTCLYNANALKDAKSIIVTEGELDCMSLHQLGIHNVVSVPLGAETFNTDHQEALENIDRLYLSFDPDPAGRRGAKKIANRLDPSRCFNVILPGVKDANEFLQNGGTREQFEHLMREAKPFGEPATYSVHTAIGELSTNMEQAGQIIEGPTFPWENVQELFGPMGYGETTVVLGNAGVGKTSYVLQILTHVAKNCNLPALMMCLEMPIFRLAQLLIAQHTYSDRRQVQTSHIVQTDLSLHNIPLTFLRRPPALDWKTVKPALTKAIRKFGIKVWAVDNLQFLTRGDNMVNEVGIASRNLKMLAEDTNTHCIIVSHPRKSSQGTILTQHDILWSQAVAADADNIHTLSRQLVTDPGKAMKDPDFQESTKTYEDRTIIHAAKTRYGGGGKSLLYLHGPSGVFIYNK